MWLLLNYTIFSLQIIADVDVSSVISDVQVRPKRAWHSKKNKIEGSFICL
jgi:hypothetical protein